MTSTNHSMIRKRFALIVGGILLVMGIVPVLGMVLFSLYLERGCALLGATDGEASSSFLWRIETQRCGEGPVMTNVLVAPRGKSLEVKDIVDHRQQHGGIRDLVRPNLAFDHVETSGGKIHDGQPDLPRDGAMLRPRSNFQTVRYTGGVGR